MSVDKMTIFITEEDFKAADGHQMDGSSCLIAQAILRQSQAKPGDVEVSGGESILIGEDDWVGATAKDKARIDRIVGDFDSGTIAVEPLKITIKKVSEAPEAEYPW